jgi:hypothetical protein
MAFTVVDTAMIEIIIRACGERTELKCRGLAKQQGNIHVVSVRPFGQSIRETFRIGSGLSTKWVCVVDADTLLHAGVLQKAIEELDNAEKEGQNIFCLDGNTIDKILMMPRRAGIHIYNRDLMGKALLQDWINDIDNQIKPETFCRNKMAELGHRTYLSSMIFGTHDYEQYYRDLWRKAVCQTRKLKNMIRNKPDKWRQLSATDNDYKVIYAAHRFGNKYIKDNEITIDIYNDYNAAENIEFLGLKEKESL